MLVIEDGPTLTHGEMRYGAGLVAATRLQAAEIVDPRPYAQGSIKAVFEKYPHLTQVLPAMGYGERQVAELAATVKAVPCDAVLIATPDRPAARHHHRQAGDPRDLRTRGARPRGPAARRRGGTGREEGSGDPWLTRTISRSRTWTRPATLAVLERAARLKREVREGKPHPLLAGRTLAMIFQKPSLRTRVSFEVGMTQLGGHAIYLGPADIKLGERETVEDIALTISRMCDIIMARVFGHDVVAGLAQHATVPVINALSDREHPCQVLADLQTIQERKGRFEGLKAVFVGDGNNVAQSFLYGGALLGMSVTRGLPEGLRARRRPGRRRRRDREGHGRGHRRSRTTREAAAGGADVLYTDVWASMGQESEAAQRKAAFHGFQIDAGLMAVAKPDAIVLHCLPAHYGEEIDYAVSRTPNSAIFDQAENRLHAQKALMVHLMKT